MHDEDTEAGPAGEVPGRVQGADNTPTRRQIKVSSFSKIKVMKNTKRYRLAFWRRSRRSREGKCNR